MICTLALHDIDTRDKRPQVSMQAYTDLYTHMGILWRRRPKRRRRPKQRRRLAGRNRRTQISRKNKRQAHVYSVPNKTESIMRLPPSSS